MTSPTLPAARGELSAAVRAAILGDDRPLPSSVTADPYGEDLTLALHLCYELHYRGFAEGLGDLEWSPELLRLRAAMERVFLDAVRADVAGGSDVSGELAKLLIETVPGSGDQVEFATQRQLQGIAVFNEDSGAPEFRVETGGDDRSQADIRRGDVSGSRFGGGDGDGAGSSSRESNLRLANLLAVAGVAQRVDAASPARADRADEPIRSDNRSVRCGHFNRSFDQDRAVRGRADSPAVHRSRIPRAKPFKPRTAPPTRWGGSWFPLSQSTQETGESKWPGVVG